MVVCNVDPCSPRNLLRDKASNHHPTTGYRRPDAPRIHSSPTFKPRNVCCSCDREMIRENRR